MARPRKADEDKYETPKRSLGRVDDDDWAEIQAAAAAAKERGDVQTQSQWMLKKLLAAARREANKP